VLLSAAVVASMDTVNHQENATASRDISKKKKSLTRFVNQFVKVNVKRIKPVWHPINVTAARVMLILALSADFEWKFIKYSKGNNHTTV